MQNRGQVVTVDLLLGFSIFIALFLMLDPILQEYGTQSNIAGDYGTSSGISQDYDQIYFKSQNSMIALLYTRGVPEFWDPSNILIIGIVDAPQYISNERLARLMNLSANSTSLAAEKMGLAGYKIAFDVEYENGTIAQVNSSYYFGNASFQDVFGNDSVISLKQRGIYNNQRVFTVLKVSKT